MLNDHHHLQRFVDAQSSVYQQALGELREGQKRTHWMWFIFPQLDGLGRSETAQFYSIKSTKEAVAYLNHAVLGERLLECTEAMLALKGKSAREVLGYPDDLKFHSSMTLFVAVPFGMPAFQRAIDRFFDGKYDLRTLELLAKFET